MSSPSPGKTERVALSQDLTDFLLELSLALHRTSMYPWGHPSLERAAATVVSRLSGLLTERATISIGVAKRQMVIEGVATDPKHPMLRGLAEKLHRNHIGAIVFERGAATEEVVSMMRLIGAEPERDATPLGLGNLDVLRQWRFVRLYPLTYEQLEMADGKESGEEQRGTRSAQLWIGLAQAALATDSPDNAVGGSVPIDSGNAAAIAQAINAKSGAQAYDQVIVGYMLQLAEELKDEESAADSADVRARLSDLIHGLDRTTLERLVTMGGDLRQRKQFVMDAADAMNVDAVIEIVQAAAAATQQSISTSMMRLLTKMSAFADQGSELMQMQADEALRDQVQQLIGNWTLEDPNPDTYTRALESLAHRPQALASTAQTSYAPEPIRIVHMSLEVDVVGVPFWRAVAEVLETEGVGPLIRAVEAAPPDNKAARELWMRLATPDNLRELLARDAIDFEAVGRILDQMKVDEGAAILMEALVESELRATRMGILKRLASLELDVLEPLIRKRLTDQRWYVRRNMLYLLNLKGVTSQVVQPSLLALHADPRVRREAYLLWMRNPLDRERAVCTALTDPDERMLRAAIVQARENCPAAAVPMIARRLDDELPSDIRSSLVGLLGGIRSPAALDLLLGIAVSGKSLLGKPKLAAKSPEMLAAFKLLATEWADEPRVSAALARIDENSDADLRAAIKPRGPGE